MGRAFVFRADLSLGRAAGWIAAETADSDVLDAIQEGLHRRIRSAGRFVEARVLQEEDDRFAVVFVGRQDPSIEEFLSDSLARRGRLSHRVPVTDDDLVASGADLASEHVRLETWRATHADRPVAAFRSVPRSEGGPHPLIDWLESDEGPVAVLRGTELHVRRAATKSRNSIPEEGGTWRLRFELTAEGLEELRVFAAVHPGRSIAIVLDGRVLELWAADDPPENPLYAGGGWTIEEGRACAFSLTGELPLPLVFEGFSKRRLLGTREKGE